MRPVFQCCALTCAPLSQRRDAADRAAARDRRVEQGARPVRAVELGLVDRRARRPRAGVERHRRRRAGLRLDVADDVLEGALQRCRIAAEEGRRIAAAEVGHLVQGGDRAGIGERVAHADDIGLDVIAASRDRRRAQCGQLVEDVALRLAVRPHAGGLRVLPLRRVVLAAVGAAGRVAVRREHDEIALARLRDRRAAAAEVVLHRAQGAGDRRVEGVVLDLSGAAAGLAAEQRRHGREVARRVGAHRFVDVAAPGDVVAVAPAASDPDLARHARSGRQIAGIGRRERKASLVVAVGRARPVGRVVVAGVDVVGRAGDAETIECVLSPRRIEDVVDVRVVTASLIGDGRIAVARVRIRDAATTRVAGRDAGDAVVGVDHRRRVAEVVGVRVVERRPSGAEAGDAEVERVAVRRQHAPQDAARDVAARVRVVAVDDLAGHRRVHRLRVVEDDHHVRPDRRREEQRVRREGERRRGERRERCREQQRGEATGGSGDRLHDDLR